MSRPDGGDAAANGLQRTFERVLAAPTPDDVWDLQKALLTVGGPEAARARAIARAFHTCLRTLESKSASRRASRWSAVLGTAAIGAVSLSELRNSQDRGLEELLQHAVPAVLEVGAALKGAEAWEIEASLTYDEFAWFLYDELWDVSATTRPDLGADERRRRVDDVIEPLLDVDLPDTARATLIVQVFRSLLAARVLPLLAASRG